MMYVSMYPWGMVDECGLEFQLWLTSLFGRSEWKFTYDDDMKFEYGK